MILATVHMSTFLFVCAFGLALGMAMAAGRRR
jgi:hypothetical protein